MFIFDLIKMINISVHSSETKLFSDEEKYRIGFFLYSHVTCKLNFNILLVFQSFEHTPAVLKS